MITRTITGINKTAVLMAIPMILMAIIIILDRATPDPVAENMSMSEITRTDDGWVTARITGTKLRNCQPIVNSESGYMQIDGPPWYEIRFRFLDDISPGSSKPVGDNDFGLWSWLDNGAATTLVMTISHICDGKLVLSTFGPFEVSR